MDTLRNVILIFIIYRALAKEDYKSNNLIITQKMTSLDNLVVAVEVITFLQGIPQAAIVTTQCLSV